jgi:hypothetical protein
MNASKLPWKVLAYTGNPIWNILEDTCRLTLANPAKIKNSRERKPTSRMPRGSLNCIDVDSSKEALFPKKKFETCGI